jgi:hypothetical protein
MPAWFYTLAGVTITGVVVDVHLHFWPGVISAKIFEGF